MIRTNILLTEQQRQQLAEMAEDTGITAAEHVRRAINQYLSLHGGQLAEVLAEAHKTFPDTEGDDDKAMRRALFHWMHDRQENSIRGGIRRLEAKIDRLLKEKPNG